MTTVNTSTSPVTVTANASISVPTLTGNAGKYLTNDGTATSWAAVAAGGGSGGATPGPFLFYSDQTNGANYYTQGVAFDDDGNTYVATNGSTGTLWTGGQIVALSKIDVTGTLAWSVWIGSTDGTDPRTLRGMGVGGGVVWLLTENTTTGDNYVSAITTGTHDLLVSMQLPWAATRIAVNALGHVLIAKGNLVFDELLWLDSVGNTVTSLQATPSSGSFDDVFLLVGASGDFYAAWYTNTDGRTSLYRIDANIAAADAATFITADLTDPSSTPAGICASGDGYIFVKYADGAGDYLHCVDETGATRFHMTLDSAGGAFTSHNRNGVIRWLPGTQVRVQPVSNRGVGGIAEIIDVWDTSAMGTQLTMNSTIASSGPVNVGSTGYGFSVTYGTLDVACALVQPAAQIVTAAWSSVAFGAIGWIRISSTFILDSTGNLTLPAGYPSGGTNLLTFSATTPTVPADSLTALHGASDETPFYVVALA